MDNQPNPDLVTEEPTSPKSQPVPGTPADSVGGQPTSSTNTSPTLNQPGLSHRKLWLIVGTIVVLVIIGALICIAVGAGSTTTKPVSTSSTGNPSANDMTSSMTQGANGESSITSTDDSGAPASMNQSASNVGDSVNENNF